MREIIIVGRFCRTRVSPNGKLRTENALFRVGRRGCERGCAGEVRRGRAEHNRAEGNDGFRLRTSLLKLHSLSRSRDTASVLPYGNLSSPPKGKLAGSAAPHRAFARAPFRLFLAAPRPAPPTAHRPRVRSRAASLIPRRPASRSAHRPPYARSPARRFAYPSPPRVPLRPLPTAHAFARAPFRLFLAAPRPVLTTDHEPLFTVRYFIARAAFEC